MSKKIKNYCTCDPDPKKRQKDYDHVHSKYREVEITEDKICIDCGYYTIQSTDIEKFIRDKTPQRNDRTCADVTRERENKKYDWTYSEEYDIF